MNNAVNSQHKVVFYVVLLVLWLGMGFESVLAGEGGGPISYGDTVKGIIDDEGYYHNWWFEGNAGDVVSISTYAPASDGDLDTILELWYYSGEYEILKEDDDSGGGDNGTDSAIISFSLPYDGEYEISVSRFDYGEGTTNGMYYLFLDLESYGSDSGSNFSSEESAQTQRNQYTPVDYWLPSFISDDCPTGGFCLKADTFKWASNKITYCIASTSGTEVFTMNHRFDIFGGTVTNANIQTMAREAIRYWEDLINFDFTEDTSCDFSNIIIGWVNVSTLQSIVGSSSAHPLGVATKSGSKTNQQIVYINMDDYDWDRDSSTSNWDLANTLAHEIGHALGVMHDEYYGTLMYPSSPAYTRLSSNLLGTDAQNQLADIYPEWTPWTNTRQGVNMRVFETVTDRSSFVSVDYPEGASNLHVLCAVHGYIPVTDFNDDADAGWSCTWEFDNSNQKANFTLTPTNMDPNGGSIMATAIVFDADVFTIPAEYYFVAESEGSFSGNIKIHPTTYYDEINGGEYGELDLSWIPNDAIPVITITEYYTGGDDDFSFWVDVVNVGTSNPYIDAYGWEGRGSSWIAGYITFLQPANSNARVATCFTSGGNDINQGYTFPGGSCTDSYIEPNMNTVAFPSLIGYATNKEDYYSAMMTLGLADQSGGGLSLNGTMQIFNGDNSSSAQFQVLILQSR